MQRRNMLSLLAATAAAPALAQLRSQAPQPQVPAPDAKPYDVLAQPIAGDRKRVRLLFAYDCPFCLRYHNGLVSWGASLPSGVTFDAYPVIPDGENPKVAMAVVGRLIGQALAPKSLPAFDYAMYTAIQGDPMSSILPSSKMTMDDVLDALVQAGVNQREMQQFLRTKGKGIEKRLSAHVSAIKTYQLTATPSVAIGGRYVVNPDHSQGNPQHMLLLLNGIVSRVVQGDTHAL